MNNDGIELLDSIRHKNVKIDAALVDVPSNRINAVNIMANELANLVHEYPIFISKSKNTGLFGLTALLGLHSGENLFIRDNRWHANYLPLDILRRPFQAMLHEDDDFSKGQIAIDINSEQVKSGKGEVLFDSEGESSAYLERIKQTFSQILAGSEHTKACMKSMAELNLIEPIDLQFDSIRGGKFTFNGLYRVNKDVLSNLSGDALETAHKNGVLQIAHLIMSSGAHLQKLINWSNE